MTFAVLIDHDCHQQRRLRPSCLDQELALHQDVVVAVSLAVVRIGPPIQDVLLVDSIVVLVADGLDLTIGNRVDLVELGPRLRRQRNECRQHLLRLAFGRLGGAEMARCEKAMDGSIPLSTLRTRVEYGFAEASTAQGNIGIKCWINNGDYLTEESTDAANAQTRQVSQKPARTRKR